MKKTIATILALMLVLSLPVFALASGTLPMCASPSMPTWAAAGRYRHRAGLLCPGGHQPHRIVESGPSKWRRHVPITVRWIAALSARAYRGTPWTPTATSSSLSSWTTFPTPMLMVARKGVITDANANGFYDYDELYAGLKGRTIYVDTATTPGGWFKDLLNKIHTELGTPDAENCGSTPKPPIMLTIPPPTAMRKIQDHRGAAGQRKPARRHEHHRCQPRGCGRGLCACAGHHRGQQCRYGADRHTALLLAGQYFPSTWASQKWLDEALTWWYKTRWSRRSTRGDPANQAMRLAAGENLQKPTGSFDAAAAVWPTAEEYKEWFATPEGKGYQLMQVLYEAKRAACPKARRPKRWKTA